MVNKRKEHCPSIPSMSSASRIFIKPAWEHTPPDKVDMRPIQLFISNLLFFVNDFPVIETCDNDDITRNDFPHWELAKWLASAGYALEVTQEHFKGDTSFCISKAYNPSPALSIHMFDAAGKRSSKTFC